MKEKYKTIFMSILIIAMFGISLVVANNNQIVSTSANASGSKTIGWGIKRANNNIINLTREKELKARKNVMHLIRLLIMGTEILEGKGINTYRENDKELFLNIRNGEYTFAEVYEMAENLEESFKYASDNTTLPEKPSYKKVEELLMNIYMEVLNENK